MQHKSLIFLTGSLSIMMAETSFAGTLHADAGVTSDYVWRGITQTNGRPAVQGGLEYVTEGAWYFGAWVSNTTYGVNGENSPELDYYIGLSNKGKSTAYDLGMIKYTYPESSNYDFTELYFAFLLENYTFKYSTSSEAGTYIEANTSYKLSIKKDTSIGLHVGHYQVKGGSNYFDANVAIHISEFSFTLSKATANSQHNKDLKFYVGWHRAF